LLEREEETNKQGDCSLRGRKEAVWKRKYSQLKWWDDRLKV
jgi:hypothetical protein